MAGLVQELASRLASIPQAPEATAQPEPEAPSYAEPAYAEPEAPAAMESPSWRTETPSWQQPETPAAVETPSLQTESPPAEPPAPPSWYQREPEVATPPAAATWYQPEPEVATPPSAASWYQPEPEPTGTESEVPSTETPSYYPEPAVESATPETVASASGSVDLISGRVLVSISPVPDFDRLLSLDGALGRMEDVRNVTLADYAREEVTFRIEIDNPISPESFASRLAETGNQRVEVTSASEGSIALTLIS
jgi:hypothetical protein